MKDYSATEQLFGSLSVAGAATFSSLGTFNLNTSALPAPSVTGTVLQLGNADTSNTRLWLDSFAGVSFLIFRRADGTNAAKSAVQNGETIGSIGNFGYGATAYSSSSRAAISFMAAQNWTDSAQGTSIGLFATAAGTTTQNQVATVDAAGIQNTAIGATTPSTGAFTTLQATGTATFAGINATSIGATTPGTGAFTSLSTTSSVTLYAGSSALYVTSPSDTNLNIRATGSAADARVWRLNSPGDGSLNFMTVNDAYSAATTALQLTRSGATPNGVNILTPFAVTGTASFSALASFQPALVGTAGAVNRINLYGSTYGFGVSSGSLDYVTGGNHTFYSGATVAGTVTSAGFNGAVGATTPATGTFTTLSASVSIQSNGYLQSYSSSAPTDSKYWRLYPDGTGSLYLQTVNDAYNTTSNAVTFSRSGNTPTGASFTGTLTASANIAANGGTLQANGTNAILNLNKAASGGANYIIGYTNTAARWQLIPGNTVSETGSNAGSDFSITSFNDAGTFIQHVIYATRAGGISNLVVGAQDQLAAWTAYTPTFVFTGGAGGTATANNFSYRKFGKTLYIRGQVTYTFTTAPTSFTFTLPSGCTGVAGSAQVGDALNLTSFVGASGLLSAGGTTVAVRSATGGSPSATSGQVIAISAVFEVQ